MFLVSNRSTFMETIYIQCSWCQVLCGSHKILPVLHHSVDFKFMVLWETGSTELTYSICQNRILLNSLLSDASSHAYASTAQIKRCLLLKAKPEEPMGMFG